MEAEGGPILGGPALRAALGAAPVAVSDALPMTRKALNDVVDQLDRLAVLLQEGLPASLRQSQALTPMDSAYLAALDALAVADLPDVTAVRAKLKPLVAAWHELRTGSAVVAVARPHALQTTPVSLLAQMRNLSIASWLV